MRGMPRNRVERFLVIACLGVWCVGLVALFVELDRRPRGARSPTATAPLAGSSQRAAASPPGPTAVASEPSSTAAPPSPVSPAPTPRSGQSPAAALPAPTATTTAPPPATATPAATPAPTVAPPATPTPGTAFRPLPELLQQVDAAVAGLRTGEIEAVIEYAGGARSTVQVRFALGDARQLEAIHLATTYRAATGARTDERVLVGDRAWQREPEGWVPTSRDGMREQVQSYLFLPGAIATAGATPHPAGDDVELHYREAEGDTTTILTVDRATGTPRALFRVERASGTVLRVRYRGWNTPVKIEPPFPLAPPAVPPAATSPAAPTVGLAPTGGPAQAPALVAGRPGPQRGAVRVQSLNLRSGPGLRFPVLATLPRGTPVELTGGRQFADAYLWVEVVTADGTRGWLLGEPIGVD
jgi:hypothetical protein